MSRVGVGGERVVSVSAPRSPSSSHAHAHAHARVAGVLVLGAFCGLLFLLGLGHFFPSGRARAPRLRHLHGHGHGAEELEQMADGWRNTWYIIRWHTLGVYTAYCTYSNRVEEGAGRS